ncbi:WYL domain-containing protein (plasmid) [Nostoc sp. C052]|uniref:WYL domain-containing protein n=1 Tax=Nostoc sp. C052 TaxID=2576902 RepID=UPI0015C334F8|nr:WYL domain-containing protein [Nostoc sp. C052]QLE46387.1 WYL domain-containing protein [Nostoc sp. C052]
MIKPDRRISIKVPRTLEKTLRNVAFAKNKIYGGRGSITALLQSVASRELLFMPLTADANLPEVSGIFFCYDEEGQVLYIDKSENLKHRWQDSNLELADILNRGGVGVAWMEISPTSLTEISDILINLLHPQLNYANEDFSAILKIPETVKENLANLVNEQKKENIGDLLAAIATKKLMLFPTITEGQQKALVRGISSLVEKSNYEDANLLLLIAKQLFSENAPINAELARLSEMQLPWVLEVAGLIEKQQSFTLITDRHSYCCRYAEFWNAPVGEQRTYLRCWVENIFNSDEPAELKHNRIFRLDKTSRIQPLPNTAWNYQGLDEIEVKLYLSSSFRYTPKPEDVSIKTIEYQKSQYLEVIKRVNSVFWFFQTIQRYGDRVIVFSPTYVRQRFVDQLRNLTRLYEEFEKNL